MMKMRVTCASAAFPPRLTTFEAVNSLLSPGDEKIGVIKEVFAKEVFVSEGE